MPTPANEDEAPAAAPSSSLQVPKEWSTLKRARTTPGSVSAAAGGSNAAARARETTKKRFKSETMISNNSADSIEDICRSMCDNIGRCEDVEHELDFSDVLSHIDYRSVLEGLFGGRSPAGCDVPVVTRVFEESFMREPLSGERKCVMGTSCEAMLIDKSKPFIAVEFQVPGKAAETPQMCVLCSRKHTQRLYYDFLYRATPASCTGMIQRYGVLCDVPGEYRKDACLVMPPHGPVHCMPYPSVAYQRCHFTVQTHCMSHFISQSDSLLFQAPPATSSAPSNASACPSTAAPKKAKEDDHRPKQEKRGQC